MFGIDGNHDTHRFGFFLVPDFSMMAFTSAVEPLRLANRVSGTTLYSGATYSLDGNPVSASNGVEINVDGDINSAQNLHTVIVCAGIDVHLHCDKRLISRLRHMASHGTAIGGVCTASHILAKAGLLDGCSCTIHWENLTALAEEFPDLEVTSELFEIHRNRFTCAGGTAALDMMLHWISLFRGNKLAADVADEMLHHRIRDGSEKQRMELRNRLGVSHPKLLAVVSLMEENLEEPMTCSGLAKQVGLSTRQLERLFQKYMHNAPTRYYLELRLSRARFLLRQTSLPVLSIALAAGFVSASHFSKCYREFYGRTPSEERYTVS
ncbi:MAG: GlxA family transcriptional regulator [Rhodospirillales bacterium]|nr:GlxA family transcriptional regulator [Rhodospirillales bacterium]